jgi:hypothetical protein
MRNLFITLFFLMAAGVLSADIKQLYTERLEQNLAYQQTLLKVKEAKQKLLLYDENFIPSVSIGTTTGTTAAPGSGISITDGKPDPYTITAQVLFEKLSGTSVLFSVPYKWDAEDGHRLDSPSVTVSRKLFDESEIQYLRAKADLLNMEYLLESTEIKVLEEVVAGVLSLYQNNTASRLYAEYKTLIEESILGTKNETELAALKKKLYSIQKLFLKAEYTKEISWFYEHKENLKAEELRAGIESIAEGWKNKIPELTMFPHNRKDIESLGFYLEASQKE